jgi:type I restriction enzyme, S subunit
LIARIEADTTNADAGIAAIEREIALVREYHTRLIADVVTGKLDVRGAAVRLPEADEESESLDLAGETEDEGDTMDGASNDALEEAAA